MAHKEADELRFAPRPPKSLAHWRKPPQKSYPSTTYVAPHLCAKWRVGAATMKILCGIGVHWRPFRSLPRAVPGVSRNEGVRPRMREGRKHIRSCHEKRESDGGRDRGLCAAVRRQLRLGPGLAPVARAEPGQQGHRLHRAEGVAQGADAEVEDQGR